MPSGDGGYDHETIILTAQRERSIIPAKDRLDRASAERERIVLDFASALYLGMSHSSDSVSPWSRFSTGAPAALASPLGSGRAARWLAALQGCERATLGPSTLHLFWDLFGILAREPVAIFVDAFAYPIAKWGAERAAARAVPVREFPHHDADALSRLLARRGYQKRRPVVVTDGFCPGCGDAAPLKDYLECVQMFGGWLVLDDTQSLGVFGCAPRVSAPYGQGGGGSLVRADLGGPDIISVSSLAKGFGVPIAVLAGSEDMVGLFESRSETRVHCSPPSLPAIHAALHALVVNQARGDALRLHLARLIRRFRRNLAAAGYAARGGLFPVQSLKVTGHAAGQLHGRLHQLGIRTVLHATCSGHAPTVSLVLTAAHTYRDVDRVVRALSRLLGAETRRTLDQAVLP